MSDLIRIEKPAERITRVILNRPRKANAQNAPLLYALDAALMEASRDSAARVIILAGEGKHFSSGHDLAEIDTKLTGYTPLGVWGGFGDPAMQGFMAYEEELYFGLCWRWRNIPKPIVAEVQGKVIAAGLMLVWICDLIVASEDAVFCDPVVTTGVNGVEYFAHPWEVGARKAKEMLFTGQGITARAAERAGMVSRVVPLESLTQETLALAELIAEKPAMGLRLAKMSVNAAQDEQGFYNALRAAMSFQHLAHAQHWALHDTYADPNVEDAISKVLKLPPRE